MLVSKRKRRITNASILLVCCGLAFLGYGIFQSTMRNQTIYSGIVLTLVILLLTFFNARKRIAFLPLLKVSTWTQIHIYCGYFCAFVFLLHIEFRVPRGLLEQALALTFVAVTLSGVIGLILSRWLPRRLVSSGEPLTFEKIPYYRKQVRKDAEALIIRSEKETQSSSLSDLYMKHLDGYFRSEPGILNAVLPLSAQFQQMVAHVDAIKRYLNPEEKVLAGELSDLIESKRNIDFQHSVQLLLKLWLFVHIPFTLCLIILSVVHIYYALAFGGRL